MSDLQEIIRRLPKLAPKELEQVRQRIQLLGGASSSPKKAEQQDWLLDGFASELNRRGLWARQLKLNNPIVPSNYPQKAEGVRAHLLEGFDKERPRMVELVALGQLGAQALVDHFIRIRVPVSPKILLNNVEKVPEALENSYPGYWRSRRLGFCLEKR